MTCKFFGKIAINYSNCKTRQGELWVWGVSKAVCSHCKKKTALWVYRGVPLHCSALLTTDIEPWHCWLYCVQWKKTIIIVVITRKTVWYLVFGSALQSRCNVCLGRAMCAPLIWGPCITWLIIAAIGKIIAQWFIGLLLSCSFFKDLKIPWNEFIVQEGISKTAVDQGCMFWRHFYIQLQINSSASSVVQERERERERLIYSLDLAPGASMFRIFFSSSRSIYFTHLLHLSLNQLCLHFWTI